MLTVKFEKRTVTVPYDGSQSLLDFKKAVCELLALPVQSMCLYFNNLHLIDDFKPIRDLFPDNSTLTAVVSQPDIVQASLPAVSEIMKDKNLAQNMIMGLPGMEEFMKDNPQIKKMMNDGSLFEEFADMMKDPAHVQHAQRSMDLQIAKAQNYPGGLSLISSFLKPPTLSTTKNVNDGVSLTNPEIITPLGAYKENKMVEFTKELKKLREYGFTNTDDNLRALKQCNGDLEEAMMMLAQTPEK